MIPADISLIKDEASLRECYKQPMSRATDKVLDHLDVHCRAILALSPFACFLAREMTVPIYLLVVIRQAS